MRMINAVRIGDSGHGCFRGGTEGSRTATPFVFAVDTPARDVVAFGLG